MVNVGLDSLLTLPVLVGGLLERKKPVVILPSSFMFTFDHCLVWLIQDDVEERYQ